MTKDRLDKKLAVEHAELSRSALKRLIIGGSVSVNDKVTLDPNAKVGEMDEVKIKSTSEEVLTKTSFKVDVIYEGADCIVISKPEGMLTHSKGGLLDEETVASWLARRQKKDNTTSNREGIVHRLDRATSGVMVCAKNEESRVWLQKQFSQRKVKKTYLAVVEGEMKPKEAVIDMPIGRNPKMPQRFRVDSNGKSAITHYATENFIEKDDGLMSLLIVTPTTGRTHQLRVHFSHLKHPIVGDTFYNGRGADRLYLHALSLEITLPNSNRMTFSAKKPKSFDNPKV